MAWWQWAWVVIAMAVVASVAFFLGAWWTTRP